MTERVINAERIEQLINVFGSFDENIKRIEQAFEVHITNRGTELKVQGDEEAADKGVRAIEALMALASKGETMTQQAEALFARFDELFAQFGTDKDHMVMATIYMPDISKKPEFNAVWDRWITQGCAPARVCVEAGLGETPYMMEISVIAVKVQE